MEEAAAAAQAKQNRAKKAYHAVAISQGEISVY